MEKTREPLNWVGTSDMESSKGRPSYSFQDLCSFLFTEKCAESQISTSYEMSFSVDSKGFIKFKADPVFALDWALLKQLPLCAQNDSGGPFIQQGCGVGTQGFFTLACLWECLLMKLKDHVHRTENS